MKKLLLLLLLSIAACSPSFSQCQWDSTNVPKFNFITNCDTCICGKDTVYITAVDTNAVYVLNFANPGNSVTGTTNETVLYSYLIPANKLQVGDVIEFIARESKVGTAAGWEHRVRFGLTSSVTETQIARYDNVAGVTWIQWSRSMFIVTSPTNMAVFSPGTPSATDLTSGGGANITIDITQPNYIIFTEKLLNAADRAIFDAVIIRVSPAP